MNLANVVSKIEKNQNIGMDNTDVLIEEIIY